MIAVLALLVLVVPFVGAASALVLGHRSAPGVRVCTITASGLGLVLSVLLGVPRLGDAAAVGTVFADTAAGPAIELSVHVDALAAVMLLLATGVAFLVQVFSLGYLAEDPRYPSYAALVSVFTGAMSAVVLADDLWMLLVGWEVMGACSYFLIAHHWERADARAGAVKAFLVTRTADLGLLFAVILLGIRFDTYRISAVLRDVAHGGFYADQLWLPTLLLLVAALGKSAQVPFHTWLPDAMPGPTPISALIHAATMVAAGVYLVARTHTLFLTVPSALNLLVLVSAATMTAAAVYALGQRDLKRVLAWSTVSQLAYMFAALAVGAYPAAVLHLLAHGAFKALLFLAAGSVARAVDSTSMAEMGGLWRRLPVTFATMSLGFAALAGVVPLVGFFSKEAVVGAALDQARQGRLVWGWLAWLLVAAVVATAVLTVAYAARAWLLVFLGLPRWLGDVDPHESPRSMTVPLLVLSVPTVLGGVAVFAPDRLLGATAPSAGGLVGLGTGAVMTGLTVATLAGVVLAWRRVGGGDPWRLPNVPHPRADLVYDMGVVRPVRLLSRLARGADRDVLEVYVEGAAASTRGLGGLLGRIQTGNVQVYVTAVVVGATAVAVAAGALAS